MVIDGHKVDEECNATDDGGEECSSTHHLTDPVLTCTETTHRNIPAKGRGLIGDQDNQPIQVKNEVSSIHALHTE